jgi:AsmA protein
MRILVIIAGAVAAFFVLAAVLLMVMVDPNKYKGEVAQLVKERTGRELVFEGDVKLTYFPRLGVTTGGVRLSNPPGFGDKPFTRLSRAVVSIKILPLMGGRVEVGRVQLDGLEAHLERDENGRSSWADFLGGDNASGAATGAAADAAKPAETGPSMLSRLSLDGLRVTDGKIVWDDRRSGSYYEISDLDVDVKKIRAGQPFGFKAACGVASRRPEYQARVELSGTATLNAGDDRHVFTDLLLTASAKGKSVPGGKGEFSIGLADLKLDFERQAAQGAGLSFSAYGAKGMGQFQVANLRGEPDVKGRIDVPDFNGRELSAALTGKAPDTADAAAYQHITASLEFKYGRGYLEIPDLRASLDDARVEGRLRMTGIDQKAYNFNLRISGLDADRFLPAGKAGQTAAEAKAEQEAAAKSGRKEGLFPVEALRKMRLDGQITAERVKIKGLRLTSLRLPMMAQNGVLDIGPVEARLYDGTLRASTRVDVQGERPVLTQNLSVQGVRAKPLLSDLKGHESGFAGVLQVETLSPLVCQGDSAPALKRSMTGRVRLSVRDGVFPGVNLAGVVTDAVGRVKRAAGEHTGEGKSTQFGSIDATALIQNGVASINDLEFKAPFVRGEGRGTIDIATRQVDMTIKSKLAATTEGQGGSRDALGIPVPVRITGPWDDLSYGTDYLRAIGRGAIDAVGGVVQGIGDVITGKKTGGKSSGGLLDSVKKLF